MNLAEAVEAVAKRIADLLAPLAAPAADGPELATGDIEAQLEGHRSSLYLGLYDEATATRALEELGVLESIRRRVGADVRIRLDPAEGLLRVYRTDRPEGPAALLVEVKARVEHTAPEALRPLGFPCGDMLVIDWILLQDPGRAFPPGRSALPGQSFPGLGVSPGVVVAILRAAARLGVEAVIGVPMYYHAAVLYHRVFAYVDPVEEGRFLALERDLAGRPLAERARLVEEGRVRDATFDEPFAWKGREMAIPIGAASRAYFAAPRYADAAARTLLGSRFIVVPPPC
jgi:hypothetical protein